MDNRSETALTVRSASTVLRNKTVKMTAIQWTEAGTVDYVPHINVDQVELMAAEALEKDKGDES